MNIDEVPDGEVFLVVETPEVFKITVNGSSVSKDDHGWWVDKTFRKRSVTGLLWRGENAIVLTAEGTPTIELESIYLIGDFAVTTDDRRSFVITSELAGTEGGDLVEQGYPFFAGTMSLTQSFVLDGAPEGALLSLEGLAAVVADIWVNDTNAGQLCWDPWEIEIGDLLTEGENTIRIDLVHSLRNLLGPHHDERGELWGVNPGSFSDEGRWTDIYQFVPFGIAETTITMEYDN